MLNRNKIDIIIGIVRGHGLGRRGVKVEEEGKDVDNMAKNLLARHHKNLVWKHTFNYVFIDIYTVQQIQEVETNKEQK